MIKQLRQNLSKCRKILVDEKLDLKTRERWTQLFNNTSTALNQILKDRQMREFEMILKEIREYRKRQTEAIFEKDTTDPEKTGTL